MYSLSNWGNSLLFKSLLRVSMTNKYWILSKAVSASIYLIICFFYFLLICWLTLIHWYLKKSVEPPLYSWDSLNSHGVLSFLYIARFNLLVFSIVFPIECLHLCSWEKLVCNFFSFNIFKRFWHQSYSGL